ncbi:MAG: hypothetical protein ACO25F_03315 [Erythrobacter sp.]
MVALRSDKALQRHLRLSMESAQDSWRSQPDVAIVLDELARHGEGEPLEAQPALQRLLACTNAAQGFVELWCRSFLEPLQRHPLAQIPLRHHYRAGYGWMQLASHGQATLSLAVYEPVSGDVRATSAVFSDREQHELVLAGRARARICRTAGSSTSKVRLTSECRALDTGDMIMLGGAAEARLIDEVEGQLVLLQLARVPDAPQLTREYALESGALLKQSSGDKRVSQREMAMAVLGAMDRPDAAEAIARHAIAGPDHLRWEALRHTLALDTRHGAALLADIARQADDPLAAPAQRLEAQLRAAHPELALLEEAAPCLA